MPFPFAEDFFIRPPLPVRVQRHVRLPSPSALDRKVQDLLQDLPGEWNMSNGRFPSNDVLIMVDRMKLPCINQSVTFGSLSI